MWQLLLAKPIAVCDRLIESSLPIFYGAHDLGRSQATGHPQYDEKPVFYYRLLCNWDGLLIMSSSINLQLFKDFEVKNPFLILLHL